MPKIKKTPKNPYGLSAKQKLVIEDLVEKVKNKEPLTPVESHEKFYNSGSKNMSRVITSKNLSDEDFRGALLDGLRKRDILGHNSLIEQKLTEGLNAYSLYKGEEIPDFNARLKYIQEIHKIAGVYAPERKETKSMILKADVTEEELDRRIKQLQSELEE